MGIVNVTPDSFSDGGRHATTDAAIAHARRLVQEGADILDIGGESTRPGAPAVSVEDECARVLPVIEGLRELDVPISIDTQKPEVMRAALDAGADILNDINGFRTDAALQAAASHPTCGVITMHMQGTPQTMQQAPVYADVVREVKEFLLASATTLERAGVTRERIMLDPGFGFGKTVEHNYTLMARLSAFTSLDLPVLVGVSRKSMLGAVTGKPVHDRLAASIAAAMWAAAHGAAVLRVHDVAATVDALAIWHTVESFS